MYKSVKKVVTLNDAKTSIQLNQREWLALEEICERENIKRNQLIELISKYRGDCCLTPTIRLFEIAYFQNLASKVKKPAERQHDLKNVFKILNEINLQ